MRFIGKRLLTIGLVTFICGTLAVVALAGTTTIGNAAWQQVFSRDVNVRGQVAAFMLDDRGYVNGFVLQNGDQVRFGHGLGAALAAANIGTGAELAATGRAGISSNYGREIRVRELTVNGRTFVDVAPGPPPGGPRGPKGGHRPPPPHAAGAPPVAAPIGAPPVGAPPVGTPASAPPVGMMPPVDDLAPGATYVESVNVNGAVRTFLVGGKGEVTGFILANGAQFRLPPPVRDEILYANNGAFPRDLQISVEGSGVQTPRGTIIRPRTLTIGNRTFAVGR